LTPPPPPGCAFGKQGADWSGVLSDAFLLGLALVVLLGWRGGHQRT
jgi:hypothetical protein